jgi:hypothetical protein
VLLAAFSITAAALAPASGADPITCPSGQTATKTSSGWQCINNGNNATGGGQHQGNGEKFGKTFP